ncbi:MAG: hypothetical protein Q4D45_00670 [Lachnospiraceae bacterium]|nr:hypothetical protein [Lachnospiraceae bacterium]
MKKLVTLFATLVFSFALAVNVMAAVSPTKDTKKPENKYTETTKKSVSPKTADSEIPALLVYVTLAGAAVSVYAVKRLKEQR